MSDLEQLQTENQTLRSQLEQLTEELARTRSVERDLWSHEIYLTARKKMLGGVLAVIGALSALGLLTVWEFYTQLRDYTEAEAKGFITKRLEEDLPKIIDAELENVQRQVREVTEAVVNDAQQEFATSSAETARISVAQATIQAQAPVPQASDPGAAELFYVVAGSSPVEQDLESERDRVARMAASDSDRQELDAAFPDLWIAPPYQGNNNYALVVGGPVSRDAAEALKSKAIDYGFRKDSFLWRADKAYFITR